MHIHNEIGTLRAHPNGESVFVGSSSGVFFINTVRRAFAQAAANSRRNQISRNEGDASSTFANLPSPEDCIIGTETRSSQLSSNGRTMTTESTETTQNTDASWTRSALNDFGELPTHAIAKELLVTYFQTWHPLFPFLHGPTCLKDIEEIYVTGGGKKPKSLNLILSEKPQGHSVEQLMLALGAVSLRSDLASLQALLAAQLYLVAIMDFRSASTVGGMVIRSMFKSGLHRCPVRYTNLKTDDRDIRKRIFWSAYCLDRYVCQTLGHPLGYQDSDFDVCEPGELDLHEPVPTSNKADLGTSPEETVLHLPANHPSRTHISLHQDQSSPEAGQTGSHFRHNNQERGPAAGSVTADVEHVSRQRRDNQTAQPQFVKCSQLTGRMMELFHKSIHARSADRQHVLFLKADIDAWGNDLPSYPCHSETDSTDLTSLNRDVFLRVAQQQLLLLVNRPSLSLNPASAEFNHAAQICIGAARSIIRLLESHLNSGGSIFWPGSMNAVWMGGLVMAFTCQLKLQQVSRSVCDIISSLKVLKVMKKRWRMAQNCEAVLEMLLDSIQNPEPPIMSTGNHETHVEERQHSRPGKRPQRCDVCDENCVGSNNLDTRQRKRMSRHSPHHTPLRFKPINHQQDFNAQYDNAILSTQNNDQFLSTDMGLQPVEGEIICESHCPSFTMQHRNPSNLGFHHHSSNFGNNLVHIPVQDSEPSTFHDVFDGAAWGSLFDLTEDIGGLIPLGD